MCLASPALADLGEADVIGPSGSADEAQVFKAWCGDKRKDCKVQFIKDRLVTGSGSGIDRTQLIEAKKTHVCRYRTWGILDCTAIDRSTRLYDKEFVLTYLSSDSQRKSAVITFRNQRVSDQFERNLELWMQSNLRDIGPSIKIE